MKDYRRSGAAIVSTAAVFGDSDMVVKGKASLRKRHAGHA